MPADDLALHCCQNPDCPQHGRRGAGNLSVCGHYGKNHHRLLYCNACKARFSEFKGTPFFNAKLPHDQVLASFRQLRLGFRRNSFGDGPGIVQEPLSWCHTTTISPLNTRWTAL